MNRIIKLFLESTSITRWYHGDTSKRKTFCDQNMQRDPKLYHGNADGPGIYFTNDKDEAYGYAEPSGYLYTVDINTNAGRILTDRDKSSKNQEIIVGLIQLAYEFDPESVYYMISDFIEVVNPEDLEEWMFAHVVSKYMSEDTLINDLASIAIRVYQKDANVWAAAMVKLGIIGYLPESNVEGHHHLIIYDCDIVTIIDEVPYEQK